MLLQGASKAGSSEPGFLLFFFFLPGKRLQTDYLRGRSMKTNLTIRPDGTVTLTTWGRGESGLRWLDQLQGKQRIAAVPDAD